MVQELPHPKLGRVKGLGNPVKMSRTPPMMAKVAPALGRGHRRDPARAGTGRGRDRRAARPTGCVRDDDSRRSAGGHTPRVHPGAWVDPAAQVIGNVELAEGASIWPFTSSAATGPVHPHRPQHECAGQLGGARRRPSSRASIGEGVTIGPPQRRPRLHHRDNVRIGIGAVVLTGAVVEDKPRSAPAPWCRRARSSPPAAGHGRARQARAPDERGRARRHPPQRAWTTSSCGRRTTGHEGGGLKARDGPARHRPHAGHGGAVLLDEPGRHGRRRHQGRAAAPARTCDAARPARTATAAPS